MCAPLLDRLDRLPAPQQEALGVAFGLRVGNAPGRAAATLCGGLPTPHAGHPCRPSRGRDSLAIARVRHGDGSVGDSWFLAHAVSDAIANPDAPMPVWSSPPRVASGRTPPERS